MEVSQVRRLKELEEENRKFKQMYSELALDNKILLHVDVDRAVAGEGAAAFNVTGIRFKFTSSMCQHRIHDYLTPERKFCFASVIHGNRLFRW